MYASGIGRTDFRLCGPVPGRNIAVMAALAIRSRHSVLTNRRIDDKISLTTVWLSVICVFWSNGSDTGYFLDFAQLVQCFERRKRVDVESLDLVADLLEDRVVELEHAELDAAAAVLGDRRGLLAAVLQLSPVFNTCFLPV